MAEVGIRTVVGVPAVLTIAAAAVLASCTTQPDRPQGEVTSATPSAASARDCGRVSLDHGQRVPAASLTCLANAADVGDPATLTVVSLTVEGDEIVTGYSVTGTGLARVRLDTTADKFAGTGAGITEQTCRIKVTEAGIQTDSCTDPVPVSSPVPSTAGWSHRYHRGSGRRPRMWARLALRPRGRRAVLGGGGAGDRVGVRSRTRRTTSRAVTGWRMEANAVNRVSATSASEISSPVSGSSTAPG